METSLQLANILKGRDRFLPPATPSKRAEVYYREALADFIRAMVNRLTDALSKKKLTDAVAISDDDYIDALIATLSSIAGERMEGKAEKLAKNFANKVQFQNKDQFKRNFNNAFGVDIGSVIDKEVLGDTMTAAISENVSLIQSIKTDFINDIGSNVFTRFKKGFRHADMINEIRERGNVTYSRAKLIARDQTAKLNAAFEEERSIKLGFDEYVWQGTGDERERESHRVLNGMLCKYSDPTIYSDDDGKTWKKRSTIGAFIGKPGEDYQCRCLKKSRIRF
ncbi:MAG: hypothetical protein [Caudoviricetes sp.]|nr:MAG: hypothetical protein [Caudoviricetes sp.]